MMILVHSGIMLKEMYKNLFTTMELVLEQLFHKRTLKWTKLYFELVVNVQFLQPYFLLFVLLKVLVQNSIPCHCWEQIVVLFLLSAPISLYAIECSPLQFQKIRFFTVPTYKVYKAS